MALKELLKFKGLVSSGKNIWLLDINHLCRSETKEVIVWSFEVPWTWHQIDLTFNYLMKQIVFLLLK